MDELRTRLEAFLSYLGKLERNLPKTLKAFRAQEMRLLALERLIQLTVEAACDLNYLILETKGAETPESGHASFTNLAQAGVIEHDLAERLSPLVGLRNRLVHDYTAIDSRVVFHSIQRALPALRTYGERIGAFLECHGKSG